MSKYLKLRNILRSRNDICDSKVLIVIFNIKKFW